MNPNSPYRTFGNVKAAHDLERMLSSEFIEYLTPVSKFLGEYFRYLNLIDLEVKSSKLKNKVLILLTNESKDKVRQSVWPESIKTRVLNIIVAHLRMSRKNDMSRNDLLRKLNSEKV